ncbi:MAG: tetratricopeptide repeat protein [Candidatus Hodarchaeota archaeon]
MRLFNFLRKRKTVLNKTVLDYLRQGKTTIFVGAGVSIIPPSCLPTWWQMNHSILDALTEEAREYIPDINNLTEKIKKREEEGKLPPEFVAELITERFGESYFEVLQALEGETPNQVHFWLATLAKAGLVKTIITTNFDTLIERAFKSLGVPLRVLVEPKDYEGVDLSFSKTERACLLLKLHGTATKPSTCIDTLAERKRGFPPVINQLINDMGKETFWVILGYSGADLDAEPNYLGLRTRSTSSPGFFWLHLPNTTPLPIVSELAHLYGSKRGMIEFGVLPDWLNGLTTILPSQISPPKPLTLSPQKLQETKMEATKKVILHARNWAKERGIAESAIVLIDLAIKAGQRQDAQKALLKLLEGEKDLELTEFGLGIVYQDLASIASHFGENEKALSYYQKSRSYYQKIENKEGEFYTLQAIASLLQNFGRYKEAEEQLMEYLEFARKADEPDVLAGAFGVIAHFYNETGQFQKALDLLQEALPLSIQHGLEEQRAGILIQLGQVVDEFGRTEEAENYLLQAKEIYTRLGNDSSLSVILRRLASISWKRGENEKSSQLLEQARIKAELAGDKVALVKIERRKGLILIQQGNYPDAEILLQKTAKEAETMGEFEMLIITWQDLAFTLQMQGKINKALEVYNKLIGTAEEAGLDVRAAGARVNYGILLEQQGQLQEALENYQSANEVFTRVGQLESLAGALGNIGNIYYRLGDYENAKTHYEKSLKIFEELQDLNNYMRTLSNVANLSFQLGELEKAWGQYQEIIELAEKYEQYQLRDSMYVNYASALYQVKEFTTALELFNKAYESSKGRKDFLLAGTSIYYAGLTHLELNQTQEAKKAIEESISVWESLEESPQLLEQAQETLQSLKTQQKTQRNEENESQ